MAYYVTHENNVGTRTKKIFHQKLFALTSKLFYLHRGGDYERTHNDNGRSGYEVILVQVPGAREQERAELPCSQHGRSDREMVTVSWVTSGTGFTRISFQIKSKHSKIAFFLAELILPFTI